MTIEIHIWRITQDKYLILFPRGTFDPLYKDQTGILYDINENLVQTFTEKLHSMVFTDILYWALEIQNQLPDQNADSWNENGQIIIRTGIRKFIYQRNDEWVQITTGMHLSELMQINFNISPCNLKAIINKLMICKPKILTVNRDTDPSYFETIGIDYNQCLAERKAGTLRLPVT